MGRSYSKPTIQDIRSHFEYAFDDLCHKLSNNINNAKKNIKLVLKNTTENASLKTLYKIQTEFIPTILEQISCSSKSASKHIRKASCLISKIIRDKEMENDVITKLKQENAQLKENLEAYKPNSHNPYLLSPTAPSLDKMIV